MSMDTQTKELIQLWNLLELGFELNLRYADTGIINEGDEDVVINVTAIAETAEQWNEPIEPKQVSMFEAVGLVAVVSLVNDYMEEPVAYKRGSVIGRSMYPGSWLALLFLKFGPEVIVPVLVYRTEPLHLQAHVLQRIRHAVAGVIARVIVVEAEVHRVQLWILPQPFQHRLDGCPAAGDVAVLLPSVGVEGDVGQEIDGGLEHIEGLVRAVLMKAVLACAALNVHTEHPALAVGAADVGMLCFAAAIQPHENAVVMLVLVEQLFMYKGRNNLAVDVALTHEIGIHTPHGSVRLRQREGLRSLLCGLCLRIRFSILFAQQKQNRLLIRETVIALHEADGIAALAFGVVEPLVAPDGDAGIVGRAELSAGAHGPFALGAQQRHEIRVLRPRLFLRRKINIFAHDVSFQNSALRYLNVCSSWSSGLCPIASRLRCNS